MKNLAFAILASFTTYANAALFDRGGGLIYDDSLDVTWLQDASYAKSSGYDSDGIMTWSEASVWANSLTYYDNVRDSNIGGWRLPRGDGCSGFFCTASELGHLFYETLGGQAMNSLSSVHNANYNYFSNVQDTIYWTETLYVPYISFIVVGFDYGASNQLYGAGYQFPYVTGNDATPWLLRDGDVATIPEPGTLTLLWTAFISIVFLRKSNRVV